MTESRPPVAYPTGTYLRLAPSGASNGVHMRHPAAPLLISGKSGRKLIEARRPPTDRQTS